MATKGFELGEITITPRGDHINVAFQLTGSGLQGTIVNIVASLPNDEYSILDVQLHAARAAQDLLSQLLDGF